MKKLLISSMKSFCLSPMKFFSLRLDRFTQLLYTFSAKVSLEFVSPDFRLTVGEDLLPLSVQKSPNLCVFSIQFLTSFDNGLPRSIGHGRRRLTNREAFSLGVIDLFSVCFEEHLPDFGIVVIRNRCSVVDSVRDSTRVCVKK